MSYNSKLPMDDEYIAAGPADIRENFRALKEDQIVDAGTLAGLSAGNASGNIPKSNGIVNANLNADLLDGQEANAFATASHAHSAATTSTAGFMSAVDKTKMDGITTGAQVNQNAFGNVVVGTTTIQADSATDTLTLTAGTNISLTPDATNDAVTIAVSGTVPLAATATNCSGNAATATKWAIPRALSFTGDATGSMSVDGSAAANAELTLTPTGVTAGNYRSVTVDAKGRVTAGANPTTEAIDITGNAATATSCGSVTNDSGNMQFHWNGQSGQPTWLWGGNDFSNMNVYNPSNFRVNYADTAGNANMLNGKTVADLGMVYLNKQYTATFDGHILQITGQPAAATTATGTIGHGQIIPVPSGYTRNQIYRVDLTPVSGSANGHTPNAYSYDYSSGQVVCYIDVTSTYTSGSYTGPTTTTRYYGSAYYTLYAAQ
jgi:hypothetical protein